MNEADNLKKLGLGTQPITGTAVQPEFYTLPETELSQGDILDNILDYYHEEIVPAQESINELVLKNRKLPKEEQDKHYTESIESYYREL